MSGAARAAAVVSLGYADLMNGGLRVSVAVVIACGCGTAPTEATRPPSKSTTAGVPTAEDGWELSGNGRDVYSVSRDGDALLLAPVADTHDRYGTWMRHIDATPYRGKRVRISTSVKTEGATKRVDVWSRTLRKDALGDGPGLGGDWKQLDATSDFVSRAMVFDVDEDSDFLQYGVGIAGPGRVWIGGVRIEVVGDDVPTTTGYEGEKIVDGWLMTGVGAPDYELAPDGGAIRAEKKVAETSRFVAVVQRTRANAFSGKRVKATFEVRVDGVKDGVCVMKVQTVERLQYGGFLAVDTKQPVDASKGFVTCELASELPREARWMLFGYTFRGAGRVWVRDARLIAAD